MKTASQIRKATDDDFDFIYEIINDAATAYKGVIPADRWKEPYMPAEELREQIDDGVVFYCLQRGDRVLGVMGIQERRDVQLIRHAYVKTNERGNGIGGELLKHLRGMTSQHILIGTWTAASWAIAFYTKHGFRLLPEREKDILLGTYWKIPDRQRQTSVVLASDGFRFEGKEKQRA